MLTGHLAMDLSSVETQRGNIIYYHIHQFFI